MLRLGKGSVVLNQDLSNPMSGVVQGDGEGEHYIVQWSQHDCDSEEAPSDLTLTADCRWEPRLNPVLAPSPRVNKLDDPQRAIYLPCHGIVIYLTGDGGGSISSDLKTDLTDANAAEYNAAIDGVESLILAHAVAGIDVTAPAYLQGIESMEQAVGGNFQEEYTNDVTTAPLLEQLEKLAEAKSYLENSPQVGDIYDEQHADTQTRGLVILQELIAFHRSEGTAYDGKNCPKCGKDSVVGETPHLLGYDKTYRNCSCEDCGENWTEEFRLTGIARN